MDLTSLEISSSISSLSPGIFPSKLERMEPAPSKEGAPFAVELRSGPSYSFKARRRHPFLPSWVPQLQPVPAGVEEVKLSSRKETLAPVNQVVDGDIPFAKDLARLDKSLRTDGEGMVQPIIAFRGCRHRLLPLAQQYIVVPYIEAGHDRVAKTPHWC